MVVYTAAYVVLTTLLMLSLVVVDVEAQVVLDIFGNDLTRNMCYSTTGMFARSSLSLRSKPEGREVAFTFPNTAPKVEIQCMFLIERSATSTAGLCNAVSTLWLCKAPINTNDFECEQLVDYISDPKTVTVRGTQYGPQYRWRIEWDPVAKNEFCYPRDVQFTMIGTTSFPNSGTVGAVVVFTILVVLVIGIVVVFGGATLKRRLRRKWRQEPDEPTVRSADLPPPIPLTEAMRDLEEVEAQKRHPRPLLEAPDHESFSGRRGLGMASDFSSNPDQTVYGGRDTFSPSGRVEIPKRASLYHKSLAEPLPHEEQVSPWKQRQQQLAVQASSMSPNRRPAFPQLESPDGATKRGLITSTSPGSGVSALQQITPTPPPRYIPPSEIPSVIPPEVHQRLTGAPTSPLAAGSSVKRSPVPPPDVLVCADCMLRVQERSTPRHCEVTGKRHY